MYSIYISITNVYRGGDNANRKVSTINKFGAKKR